jgi:hypothetical protein
VSDASLSGAAPATRSRRRAAWRGLLPLCLALPLLPFLAATGFPSQDGPSHIETARLLELIRAGEAPVAARFLEEFDPGLTNVLALQGLSFLLRVMPPDRAEWAMALGLTLLLLGAVLLALRLLRGRAEDAALGVLLCAPVMLYMGSFSLVLGTAFGFVALAAAARLLAGGGAGFALLFLLATLLGCAANIQVAIPVLAAAFGGVAGAALWRRLRGGRLILTRPEARLLLAALPVIGLVLLYRLRMPGGDLAEGANWHYPRQLAALLLRADTAWFWHSDLVLFLLLSLALFGAVAWWLWRGAADAQAAAAPAPWALAGSLAIAALILVLPVATTAVPQIPMRLAPFLHFLLFLWFTTAVLPTGWRRLVVALALAAGLSQVVTRSIGHRVLEARVAEMVSIEKQVPAGSVLEVVRISWLASNPVAPHDTPAHYLGGFRLRFSPFIHPGRGTAGRDIVDLGNYQLMPRWQLFRLRPRPELQAVPGFGQLDWAMHNRRITDGLAGHRGRLRAAVGRDIDYLIVWNAGVDAAARAQDDPALAAFLADLAAGFEPIGRSAPAGYAELWRRRPEEAAPPPLAGIRPE